MLRSIRPFNFEFRVNFEIRTSFLRIMTAFAHFVVSDHPWNWRYKFLMSLQSCKVWWIYTLILYSFDSFDKQDIFILSTWKVKSWNLFYLFWQYKYCTGVPSISLRIIGLLETTLDYVSLLSSLYQSHHWLCILAPQSQIIHWSKIYFGEWCTRLEEIFA